MQNRLSGGRTFPREKQGEKGAFPPGQSAREFLHWVAPKRFFFFPAGNAGWEWDPPRSKRCRFFPIFQRFSSDFPAILPIFPLFPAERSRSGMLRTAAHPKPACFSPLFPAKNAWKKQFQPANHPWIFPLDTASPWIYGIFPPPKLPFPGINPRERLRAASAEFPADLFSLPNREKRGGIGIFSSSSSSSGSRPRIPHIPKLTVWDTSMCFSARNSPPPPPGHGHIPKVLEVFFTPQT